MLVRSRFALPLLAALVATAPAAFGRASADATVVLAGHIAPIRQAVFSPDGQLVVTLSEDRTARLFDAASGEVRRVLAGHEDAVIAAAFSPDGSRLVTGSDDGTARVWDVASGKSLAVLEAGLPIPEEDLPTTLLAVSGIAFSPDASRIVTFAETHEFDMSAPISGSVRVWDASSGERLFTLTEPREDQSAAFSPDGERLVTTAAQGVYVVDVASGRVLRAPPAGEDSASIASYSPDGTRIVVGAWRQGARILDADSFEVLSKFPVDRGDLVVDTSFSSDGTRLLVATERGAARVYDLSSGALLAAFLDAEGLRNATFSPDGKLLLTMSKAGTLRLRNLETGRELYAVRADSGYFRSGVFSPDGSRILGVPVGDRGFVWETMAAPEIPAQ